jgi:hypothetical protein
MIFILVGVFVGVGLLVYGNKKGWLGPDPNVKKEEDEGKTVKEMVNDDDEVFDPYADFYKNFKAKCENDEDFKEKFREFTNKRKEEFFKGLNEQEKQKLDAYLKEEAKRMAENKKTEKDVIYGQRDLMCEIFVFISLSIFVYWAAARHLGWVSPQDIFSTFVNSIEKITATKTEL